MAQPKTKTAKKPTRAQISAGLRQLVSTSETNERSHRAVRLAMALAGPKQKRKNLKRS